MLAKGSISARTQVTGSVGQANQNGFPFFLSPPPPFPTEVDATSRGANTNDAIKAKPIEWKLAETTPIFSIGSLNESGEASTWRDTDTDTSLV